MPPPTAEENVVSPVAFTSRRYAPSTVPPNAALPVPVETIVSAISSTTPPGLRPNEPAASVVRTVPASFVMAGAVLVTPPTKCRSAVDWSPSVTVPVLANVTAFVIATLAPLSSTS